MNFNRKLIRDSDFKRYLVFGIPITVAFDDIYEIGKIQGFSDFTVKINDSYFCRDSCEFWYTRRRRYGSS